MLTQNGSYLPQESSYAFQGVDFLSPSVMMNPRYSPELKNVDVTLGHLSKRRGYEDLGATLSGTVLALVEFEASSGTIYLVAITTTKEYKWNGTGWDNITYKDAGAVEHARTGTEDDGLDWIVTEGNDSTGSQKRWIIITNGKDKPRYWDGTLATFYEFSTATVANHGAAIAYTNFVTCKTLSTINSYLVLGNVTTAIAEPNLVAWADTESLTNFEGENSGAVKIVDAEGKILKLLPLGDRMMIYSLNAIHSMLHIGGIQIFSFEKIIGETRLLSGRAITSVGPFHYFMAQENIYLFDGSKGVRRMANMITKRYREIFNSELKTRAWAFLEQPKNTIFFCIPTSSSAGTIFKLEYDIFDVENNRWVVHEYYDRVTCMGFFSNTSDLAWNSSTLTSTTWEGMAQRWNEGSVNKGFPVRVLGHVGKASIANDTILNDDGTAVTGSWESVDFTFPREFLSTNSRWVEMEFEARGTMLDITFSTDKGANYRPGYVKALDGSWKTYTVFLDLSSKTIRVKFENHNLNGDFELRWFRIWFTHQGVIVDG